MMHVRTSPYCPQSNGKLERYHKSLKGECIRPKLASTKEEAEKNINEYVECYNTERLHSATVTLKQMLEGLQKEILKQRLENLENACEKRRLTRQQKRRLID